MQGTQPGTRYDTATTMVGDSGEAAAKRRRTVETQATEEAAPAADAPKERKREPQRRYAPRKRKGPRPHRGLASLVAITVSHLLLYCFLLIIHAILKFCLPRFRI